MRREKKIVVSGFILGMLLTTGVAVLAAPDSPAQVENVTFSTTNDLNVTLPINFEGNFSDPFTSPYTYRLEDDSKGNMSLISPGAARVAVSTVEAEFTNLTDAYADQNVIVSEVPRKNSVTLKDTFLRFNYSDVDLDDGEADIDYNCLPATCNISIFGLPAETEMRFETESGTVIADDVTDPFGTARFELNNSHVVYARTGNATDNDNTSDGGENGSQPVLTDPKPVGELSGTPSELNISVYDDDFSDSPEEVTVEFFLDGNSVGNDTLQSPGRASAAIAPSIGQHDVRAVATDLDGRQSTYLWTFGTPGYLFLRNRTTPHGNIINQNASLRFYYDNGTIYERTAEDSATAQGAAYDLSGVPSEGRLLLDIDVDQTDPPNDTAYHVATYLVENTTGNRSYFVLKKSVNSFPVEFTLDDRTGKYEGNNATLTVQKGINLSSDNNPKWRAIHESPFKVGDTQVNMTQDERYRLIIENEEGARRVLGTYVAEQSETVPLVITSDLAGIAPETVGYDYNATYINRTSARDQIKVQYVDNEDETTLVYVTIHEFGNESRTLVDNASFPFTGVNQLSYTKTIPNASENVTSWSVDYYILRDNEWQRATAIVGPTQPALTSLPNWLAVLISLGGIWIVAGLFSQLNGDIGGLVVSGLGAFFWWIGFLPGATGIGVVILAMATAGLLFINERRGLGV